MRSLIPVTFQKQCQVKVSVWHAINHVMVQANMKEDVKQSAVETAGDPESADSSPEAAAPRPSGEGIADLGSVPAGEKDVTPIHHRLAKSVNGSGSPAGESAAAGVSPPVQQGGRRRSI